MKMQSLRNLVSRIKTAITSSTHSNTSQSSPEPIDHSEAMNILSSARRRLAIEYLADHPPDSTVTLSDLAEHVATKENDCTVEELSAKQRERICIAFYQHHMMTLEETIVDYHGDRKTITPTETPARLWSAYRAFQRSLDS